MDGVATRFIWVLGLVVGFRRRGHVPVAFLPSAHGLLAQKHWLHMDGVDVEHCYRVWMGG